MRFHILSLFPSYFESPFSVSLIKRAQERGLLSIDLIDIRNFATGRYHQVDDRPYGGGPGMVLMPSPIVEAVRSVKREGSHCIYLSPQGRPLTAQRSRELAKKRELIILCGHYEGVDERAIEAVVDEELSIGDFVLTSGAPAAIVLVDAVSRFIPGVVGNEEGVKQDSFEGGLLGEPLYTRPPLFEGREVPPLLLSGHHAKIERWRRERRREKTERVRPELLKDEKY